MKFFVPFAKDANQEQQVYEGIRLFLEDGLGAKFDDRRVRLLGFRHDGKLCQAEVGQANHVNGEPVIAILHEPGRHLYHICTPNRGVARGMSILVGENEVNDVQDFDQVEG